LQVAALKGHLSTSQHLLDRGININAVDRNHGTALQAAIYMGRKEIYDFLLGWDGPDDRTSDKADDGANDRVKVNTKGGYYGCALQVAAYRANEDLVKLLVESKKADVNIYGGKYGSPLQAAVRTGCLAVVQHILPKSNVNYRGGKYGTALQAVGRGRYRTRIRLPELSRGQIFYEWTKWDDKYGNLVQLATFSGLKKTVEMLLKYEAGPNVPDTSQRTALHIAAWSGFPQIVQLLLDNGAAINAK
ncbi:ankyrin repeat-containing domain protein, partial [Leptodontidium sp. MPI-SDFR-AT-0119]